MHIKIEGEAMKLSFEKIKEIATGAVRIEEENNSVRLYRFTKEQEELYRTTDEAFYNKTFSTAGIKLLFKTNSKKLFLKVETENFGTRKYFSVDVFADGKPVGYIDNYSDVELPHDYTTKELPVGDFCKDFLLNEGEKTICIYLPWSAKTMIKELSVDDNAYVAAVKPEKKLLAFGDSITHGYDALRPSNRYVSKLAEALGAEEFNKGIGGERFFPPLSELKEDFVPDYITVAYGTNDWNSVDAKTFQKNCREFYENLSKNYPESKIFAITPIWRKEMYEEREFGAFENVELFIKDAVSDLKNVKVIRGFDFVPKEEKYFADLILHPNDEGFVHYYKNLYSQIKSVI